MKKCFFISPMGDDSSEIKAHSDRVLKLLVTPVCDSLGYEVVRSDLGKSANVIDSDMFNHLENDELAIADLTICNPNVFWEAGYRHAKDLPIVYISKKGTALPFDGNEIKVWQYSFDYDDVEKFRADVRDYITAETSNKKEGHSSAHDNLTSDCKKFFKALYREYTRRIKKGMKPEEAIRFETSEKVSNLIHIPYDEVDYFTRQLGYRGYLHCELADEVVVFSYFTVKGMKYCEENFSGSSQS